METRKAPKWIRKSEKSHRRRRRMWKCVTALGWLGWAGSMLIRQMPDTAWWNVLKVACPAAFVSLLVLAPGKRAGRHGVAAHLLDVAMVRYEASPDRPESELTEARQRAHEIMHVERIRTAPAWIRDQRRGYRLRILGWIIPALLAVAVPAAAAVLQRGWIEPWYGAAFLAAFILYTVGALVGTRKLVKARDILAEAIERYECEAAATESDLQEAGQRAAEVWPGKSKGGKPAV